MPPVVFQKPSLVIVLSGLRVVVREALSCRLPVILLYKLLSGALLEQLDFSYMLGSYIYNLWFVSRGEFYRQQGYSSVR